MAALPLKKYFEAGFRAGIIATI